MHVLGRHVTSIAIGRQRAAVMVRVRSRRELVVQAESIVVLKRDALISRVPSTMTVVAEDDQPIAASPGSAFWITTETFDPYHVVCELPEGGP